MLAHYYTILDPTRVSNIFIWKEASWSSGKPCFQDMPCIWHGVTRLKRDLEEVKKFYPQAIAVRLNWESVESEQNININGDKFIKD